MIMIQNNLVMDVGQKAAQLRELRGWKQPEMAKRLGVSQQSLSNFEVGIVEQPRYLNKLLKMLGVTLEELWSGEIKEGAGPDPLGDQIIDNLPRLTVPDKHEVLALMLRLALKREVAGQDSSPRPLNPE